MDDDQDDYKPGKEEEEEDDDDGDVKEEDDDKDDLQEVEPPKPSPKKRTSAPKKTSAKTESKSTLNNKSVSGETAEEILAKIPDAKLPEPVEGTFNYHAAMASKSKIQQTGETVELNEAKPFCLSGFTIVFTGILPRLDREASENLAKRYGAKVTKSISGKTSLVVLGEEAGPSKVKKIKDLKIKAIDEDGFIQLINSMPAEGGDGALANAAKERRESEERKIQEEAQALAKEEERQEKEKLKKQRENKLKNSQSGSRPPPEEARVIPNSEKLWTVKYHPTNTNQLCGNKGQVQKLRTWLSNWFINQKKGFKETGKDGSGSRACLISGPPGIGKTTSAHIIAKELGFDVLEKNASDVRSKSLLNSNLKSVLNNTSVVGFFKHQNDKEHNENERKFCLIMDEVDGMSSGDHGGAGALSAFCRITNMPLILICNDKSLPKMRTFDRVTYDLPFRRPLEQEVKSRLMTIAMREGIKLDPIVIGQLVAATHNDIRQMINLLSTVSKTQKKIGPEQSKDIAKSWQKHTILKPFDITGRLLNGQIYNANSNHTLNDKINLYFNDIDFTPLMIQENYLYTRPSGAESSKDHLARVAQAADDISISDGVNSLIRSSEQQWSLLPFHAIMSSVKPSLEVAGSISQRINFAGWLGQNSKALKYQRLLQEIQYHSRLRTSTDKSELRLDYIPLLLSRLTEPILQDGESGIESVIEMMDYYYLTKEDWESIIDLGIGNSKGDAILKKIPTKVKTSFTRKYNSTNHPVAIYRTGNSLGLGKNTKKDKVDFDDVIEDDTNLPDEIEEVEDEGKIDAKKDKLIKQIKSKPTKKPKKK